MKAKQLHIELCARLREVSDCPAFEADQLLRHFCGLDRARVLADAAEVSETDCESCLAAADRRRTGEPLQYLLGEWDFYGRTFRVGEGVLIPRADTETLVEAALSWAGTQPQPLRIADLCAGSGCIAVSLALELPDAAVVAVEKSPAALAFLRENTARHHAAVAVREGDVLSPEPAAETFDLLVSNPPYITDADMERLQPEVRREPPMALRGGPDGMRFYRGITAAWAGRLRPGGMLAFEIGMGQEETVWGILENNCFKNICFHRDLCGIIRVVTGIKP